MMTWYCRTLDGYFMTILLELKCMSS